MSEFCVASVEHLAAGAPLAMFVLVRVRARIGDVCPMLDAVDSVRTAVPPSSNVDVKL